ncbi:flagellin [Massilia haematophila]|uniref:Flagellin n=1 Tax=Massilia haematophila TaxID=457923 RepID=A0ABV7PSW3_9BURK
MAVVGDGTTFGTQFDLSEAEAAYAITQDAPTAATLIAAQKAHKIADEELKAAQAASTAADAFFTATNASKTTGATGKFGSELSFQIGASSSETMKLNLTTDLDAMHLALGAVSTRYNSFGAASTALTSELTAAGSANTTVDKLQAAIDSLGAVRSSLGAATNRLDHVATNLSNVSTNTQAAAGRIMDVDFATESSNMTTKQMLMQAGTAMLKQTNQMSSMVMSLLQ